MQVTPIGMTSEQMKVSNPDAIAVLHAEATAANNERIAALAKSFGDDKDLLAKAILDPTMTVQTVKAERYDAQQAQLATLQTENAKLKTEGVVGFAAGDKPGATAPIGATDPEALEKEAVAFWNGNADVRQEFEGIYTAFLAGYKAEPHLYRKSK